MWAVDAVGMWSIPLPQRPAGQAYLVVAMHLLGDVPSPPLVGALQGTAVPALDCPLHSHLLVASRTDDSFSVWVLIAFPPGLPSLPQLQKCNLLPSMQ